MKIKFSYRIKDDANTYNTELEIPEEKVYTFTRAVTAVEKKIQLDHGSWTVEDVVHLEIDLDGGDDNAQRETNGDAVDESGN